jgi:lysyl-tRNA synthetase class I
MRQTKSWIEHMRQIIEDVTDPKERIRLENKVDIFDVPRTVTKSILTHLNSEQKTSLQEFSQWLNTIEELTEESLKNSMIKIRNNTGISANKLFQAIYLVLIGRSKGPRLGPFLTLMDLKWIRNRFSLFNKK